MTAGTRNRWPLLIGLTGPIGCGKSAVSRMLGEVGGTIVDADLWRGVPPTGQPTLSAICEQFGDDVFQPTGELDRAAMAARVFEDADALAALERIVHPEVRKLVDQALEGAAADDAPFVVIEAIKLVEGGLSDRCDEVWLIECSPATQRERLMSRGDSDEDAGRRISVQGGDLVDRLASELAGRQNGAPPFAGSRPTAPSTRRASRVGRPTGGRRRQGLAHLTAPHLNAGRTTRTFGVRWRDFR